MTAATFDTYAAAKALRESGFSEPQAAAAVAVIRDAVTEGVATKADLGGLEARLTTRLYAVAFAIVAGNTALTIGLLKLL